MYTSALFLLVGTPLLFGSWIGLTLSALLFLGLGWRTVHEERVLTAELKGYADYARRVRWRLIAFIW
jgi:protein-S-isoprenylcysteine O-methyltransferase Ste14